MGRPSKVDRLPPAIREAIGALRREGRTIDEILEHIRQLGVEDVSRAGLGRHVQQLDKIGEQMRQQRVVADALVAKFGSEPDDKLFRVNVELMHGLLFRFSLAQQEGEAVTLGPEDLMFLTSALKNIASASKTDVDRIRQIEKRAAELATKDAAEKATKAANERGLSADTVKAIRDNILGVPAA